jgi:hypothetical protein
MPWAFLAGTDNVPDAATRRDALAIWRNRLEYLYRRVVAMLHILG